MKNKIIAIAIAVFLIGSPIAFANAQTVDLTTGTQSTVNTAALQTLLGLLLQELSLLETEYAQLVASQTTLTPQPPQSDGLIGTATSTTSSTVTTPPTVTSTLPQMEQVAPQVVQTVTSTEIGTVQAPTLPVLVISQDPTISTETVQVGGVKQQIAQFVLASNSTVNTSNLELEVATTTNILSMVKIMVSGVQFGTTQQYIQAGTSYVFSSSDITIEENQPLTVSVIASISSSTQETGDIGSLVSLSLYGRTDISSQTSTGQDVVISSLQ